MRVTAVVVAAGLGKRFGSAKQFAALRGKPLVDWCLEAFEDHPDVSDMVLVLPAAEVHKDYGSIYPKLRAVVAGGRERQDSVGQGLDCVEPESETHLVLVHDGVRPLVGPELISRVIQAARESGAAVPGLPVEETLKEISGGEVTRTLDRRSIVRVQTPQGFSCALLKAALEAARDDGRYGTDEAVLVERMGRTVRVVPGDPRNIKVTTPSDLRMAEALLEG